MDVLLKLHEADNVLVALRAVKKGTTSNGLTLVDDISLAHKVASQPILAGDEVLKYGMAIGRATADIAVGEHVHIHNLQSQYTATHYREEEVK